MPDGAFRYFALGTDYSPLRGCICCDDQGNAYMVTFNGDYARVGYSLAACEARVRAGRMVETSREAVQRENEAWLQMSDSPAFQARKNSD